MSVEEDTFCFEELAPKEVAVDLLVKLDLNALKAAVSEMDSGRLSAFEKSLSKRSSAATAASVARVLVHREISRRRQVRSQGC